MSARILLVEDDPALLAVLKASIDYGGFVSDSVSDGQAAIRALTGGGFDAVLLDLGLPDQDGRELLPVLRSLTPVPIIVVSGRSSERDKVEALDLGADDYVAKPFLPGELLARIRAALRRAGAAAPARDAAGRQPEEFGALRLDPFDHTATIDGASASLKQAEYRVLRHLASAAGATVSREELVRHLYGEAAPTATNVIDVYISRIRAKLRVLGGEDVIASVRGHGWRFRAP